MRAANGFWKALRDTVEFHMVYRDVHVLRRISRAYKVV